MKDRRSFLTNGLLAVVGSLWSWRSASAGSDAGRHMYAMIVDLNRCCGCQSCVVACKAQNKTAPHLFNTRVLTGEEGAYPASRALFTPIQCNQCEDPPCVPACPHHATFKLANGIVVTDWNACEASGDCVAACPYQARFLDPDRGNKSDKCDFCLERVDAGLQPACVEACSEKARLFGNIHQPSGEFADYLSRTDLLTRKADLNIKTAVKYVPLRGSKSGGIL